MVEWGLPPNAAAVSAHGDAIGISVIDQVVAHSQIAARLALVFAGKGTN